jgi:DNA-binding NtrC family response regulator
MKRMQEYHWPGNTRELQHALEKAVILSEGQEIQPELLFPDKNKYAAKHKKTFNLEENEEQIIAAALEQFGRNISLTAEKLGINRTTLYAKMRKYGL